MLWLRLRPPKTVELALDRTAEGGCPYIKDPAGS